MTDYEAWRPALVAFYKADAWFQSAANVEQGMALCAQDRRLIEALQAAFAAVPQPVRKAA